MSDELKHLTAYERELLDERIMFHQPATMAEILGRLNAERANLRALLATILGREPGDDVAACREAAGVVLADREKLVEMEAAARNIVLTSGAIADEREGSIEGAVAPSNAYYLYGLAAGMRDVLGRIETEVLAALAGVGESGGTEGVKP